MCDAVENARQKALIAEVWNDLCQVCTKGPCSLLVLPKREQLEDVLIAEYGEEKAKGVLEKLSRIPGSIDTVASEVGVFFPEEVETAKAECKDVCPQPKIQFYTLYDKVSARKHVATLRYPRMALKKRKRLGQRYRRNSTIKPIDISGSNEEALRLVECLPQASRRTQAPLLEFQQAVKRAVGDNVHFEEQVQMSVFLEEYARWKLQAYVELENRTALDCMPNVMKKLRKNYKDECDGLLSIAEGHIEPDKRPYSLSES